MKKIISLALAAVLCLSLCACGSKPVTTTEAPAGSTAAPAASTAAPAASTAAPAGTTAAPADKPYTYTGDRLTINGADSTGTMYAAAVAIATNFTNYVDGLNVDPSTSTGSNQNALDVHDGEVELGMCSGDAGYNATHGLGKFDGNKIEDIRCVGCVYSSVVSLVALKSSGWTYLHDVKGTKGVIGIGPAASTTEVSTKVGLQVAGLEEGDGLSFKNMTLGEAADGVADGTVLAGSAFAGVPVGAQLNAAATKECVWLGFTDEELNKALEINPAYAKIDIPAGTYTSGKSVQDEAVHTFGVKCMVICREDLDEELVYNLAKALWEHADELAEGNGFFAEMRDQSYICTDTPIPLHPGAEAFYKSVGGIK